MAACISLARKLLQCQSPLSSVRQFATTAADKSRVAVVLSGCGVYDGSEIHEASAVLVHLSRSNAEVSIFAPDKNQLHVINHCTGEPVSDETRNVMVESARIARGSVSPLSSLNVDMFDAAVFPGGFGAAKNLCSFATEGAEMSVDGEVERVLIEFRAANKPLGLCCIAPVLAAKTFTGVEVTVGMDKEEGGRWPYCGTAAAIETMGAKHINRNVTELHVDSKLRVVTTPAFMCNAPLHQVYDGVGNMIQSLLKLTNNSQ